MICPVCNSSVPDSKFCENCGSPLPAAQEDASPAVQDGAASGGAGTVQIGDQELAPQAASLPADSIQDSQAIQPLSAYPTEQPAAGYQSDQPTAAYAGADVSGMATQQVGGQTYAAPAMNQPYGEQSAAGQPYGEQSAVGQPYGVAPNQPNGDAIPPYGAANASQPYGQASSVQAETPVGMATASSRDIAPNTAFVLAIIGLICAVLGVTFVVGLVLCIVALVLNARYNKEGKFNAHKTSTKVMSIIGIVVSAIALICTILFAALFAQVYQVLAENDFDPDRVEVVVNEKTGEITVRGKEEASKPASGTAESASSAAASAASAASAQASSASASGIAYSDSRCYDSHSNPTLFAIFELDGQKIADFLADADFTWDSREQWYHAPDGSYFYADGLHGNDLLEADIAKLAKGGVGSPVEWTYGATGYATPDDALAGLSANVQVDAAEHYKEVTDALVTDSSGRRYLVEFIADSTQDNIVLVRIFNQEAVEQGWFAETMNEPGVTTIEAAWEAWKP